LLINKLALISVKCKRKHLLLSSLEANEQFKIAKELADECEAILNRYSETVEYVSVISVGHR